MGKKPKTPKHLQTFEVAWRSFAALPDYQKELFVSLLSEEHVATHPRVKWIIEQYDELLDQVQREGTKKMFAVAKRMASRIVRYHGKHDLQSVVLRLKSEGKKDATIAKHPDYKAANEGKEGTADAVNQMLRRLRKKATNRSVGQRKES